MTHRNDDKYAELLTLTGETGGHIDDLEHAWLLSVVTTPAGEHINDLWMRYFIEQGITDAQYNDAIYAYLLSVGVPAATVPDMWAYAWANGLVGGAVPAGAILDRAGNPILDRNGNYIITRP